MKVYVATSWKNGYQPDVVAFLRGAGHEVYDFRHPAPGNDGFHWTSVDGDYRDWDVHRYVKALQHPVAQQGFNLDMDALRECEACVLVLASGRSAHLEAGWAKGAGKKLVIYIPAFDTPELMYSMADAIVTTLPAIQRALHEGHSMGRFLTCSACGDMDGCHRWREPNGNEFDARKYA